MGTDDHGIKAIFFDFGGVILKTFDGVDHDAIEAEFGLEAKALRKAAYRDSRYMEFQVGKCTYGEWADSISAALLKIDDRADAIMNAFMDSPRVFNQEMLGLVKRLHGRYKLGIISNTIPGMEERLRERFELVDLFDVRVGSGDLGIAKPDAGIFLHAIELAGIAPEQSVFTDDRADFAEAARSVGMQGFHFTEYEHFVEDLAVGGGGSVTIHAVFFDFGGVLGRFDRVGRARAGGALWLAGRRHRHRFLPYPGVGAGGDRTAAGTRLAGSCRPKAGRTRGSTHPGNTR